MDPMSIALTHLVVPSVRTSVFQSEVCLTKRVVNLLEFLLCSKSMLLDSQVA